MRVRVTASLGLAFFLRLLAPTSGLTDESQDDEVARVGQLLLTGVRNGRERLRRGIVRARGEKVDQSGFSPHPIRFYSAFDVEAERLRVDYTTRGHFQDNNGQNGAGEPWSSDVTEYYIRRPDASVVFNRIHDRDGPSEITVSRADQPPPRGLTRYDVRAIGLLAGSPFNRHYSLSRVCKEVYDRRPPTDVVDEGGGVWRVSAETTFPTAGYRWTLWVDRDRGFCPVRLEEHARPVPADAGRPNKMPWSLQSVSTASWSKTKGVWVPVTWRVESWTGGNMRLSYAYELEWESVNEPPPAELFEVESLNAAEGTIVTNAMGQQQFIEKVIGVPDSVLTGTVFRERKKSGMD